MISENLPTVVALKEPVQERSKRTKRNILDVARRAFTELGYDNTTTHHIAEMAGLSIGGVYAHFKNKEEIFLMVLEERSKNVYTVTRDCLERIRSNKMGLEEGIDYLFSTLYSFHAKYGKLNFEINRFVTMDERAAEIHDSWEREEEKAVMEWFVENSKRLNVDNLETAMTVMGRATHAIFHYLYKNGGNVDEKEVLSELIKMFKRYILA